MYVYAPAAADYLVINDTYNTIFPPHSQDIDMSLIHYQASPFTSRIIKDKWVKSIRKWKVTNINFFVSILCSIHIILNILSLIYRISEDLRKYGVLTLVKTKCSYDFVIHPPDSLPLILFQRENVSALNFAQRFK